MKPVFSKHQMRSYDAHAMHSLGLTTAVLMENAGRGAADFLTHTLKCTAREILIFCGGGNNGGDGLVLARHLLVRGVHPNVFLLGSADSLSNDAQAPYRAWKALGAPIHEIKEPADLRTAKDSTALAGVIVDALFGTGLNRPIQGIAADLIDAINRSDGRVVALDVPSGLHTDTGVVLGSAVRARYTVTFAGLKTGLLTPCGMAHAGSIHVTDIGVPPSIPIAQAASLLEATDIHGWLVARGPCTHKYAAGHVLVIGGSTGKTGAAYLAGSAAMRSGAGAVTLMSWPDAVSALESRVKEMMTSIISMEDVERSVHAALSRKSAVVVGPGLGLDEPAERVLRTVVLNSDRPVVLDADALSLATRDLKLLRDATCPLVLTPHTGEAARMLGVRSEDIESNRYEAVKQLVASTGATVLLKGACSIIGTLEGEIYVNSTGSPALATAGSGDVLSGMVGAFASTMSVVQAVCTAAFVHGLSGEHWAKQNGDRGLLASEVADRIPAIVGALLSEKRGADG